MRTAGCGISTDVVSIKKFPKFQVGELFSETDGVKSVAGRPKNSAELRRAFLKTFHVIHAVVENDTRVGVIDTVIYVVAELAAANRLADDFGDCGAGGRDKKAPWLRKNLDRFWEKSVEFRVDCFGE